MTISNNDIESKGVATADEIPEMPRDNGSVNNAQNNIEQQVWWERPIVSLVLMYLTYAACAAGFGVGASTLNHSSPNLDIATILVVFVGGFLSFLRHSVFHRSDEQRLGWKAPEPTNSEEPRFVNFFLIEVGFANLSWALLGLLSVVLQWGLAVQAASFLVFGMYIGQVAVLLWILKRMKHPHARKTGPIMAMTSFAVMLLYLGSRGMIVASNKNQK